MKVNQSESESRKLWVGVGNIIPLIFNPTRDELDKVLGISRDEDYEKKPEFEYLKENVELTLRKKNADGEEFEEKINVNQLRIAVWVKEIKTEQIFPMNFNLYEMDDISSSGLTKYINQHGKSCYSDTEENIPDWFKSTPGKKKFALNYRKAMKGEDQFFEFLAAWTKINPFDVENTLFPDNLKKFWQGDMKEYNNAIPSFEDNSVMAVFSVRTKETEEGIKEYQSISTRGFCNTTYMKFFRSFATKNFEGLEKNTKIGDVSMYPLFQFLESNFGQWGVKDYTLKEELQEYDADKNPVNSSKSIIETDAGY